MTQTMTKADIVAKLSAPARDALDKAFESAERRGNPYVELVHWIEILYLKERSDIALICRHFGIEPADLSAHLTRAIDALPGGASSIRNLSDHLFDAMERGWVIGTKAREGAAVRSGHILIGMLRTPRLERMLYGMSRYFERISADDLEHAFDGITEHSIEAPKAGVSAKAPPTSQAAEEESALATYATNMTEDAREGRIDAVTGRDAEVRQIVNILMRRRQNNPILTGEAGVGKTAVVEGFAKRIADGDVPPPLRDVELWSLDIGRLSAGASMKGQFEERLRQVIEEVQSSEKPIILFVDEAHMLIGAGGQAGTGDAANLLKPALARGTLRTIAATTWSEYKKHIEKDPALTRRFEVVKVEEPDPAKAIAMLRAIAGSLENHHGVMVLDEALRSAVTLSSRYIPARQLPDKAVGLLDTAAARVSVGLHAVPAKVEDLRKQIDMLEIEAGRIARETEMGLGDPERAEGVAKEIEEARQALEAVEAKWNRELDLVGQILARRAMLRGDPPPEDPETGSDEVDEDAEHPAAEEALSPEEIRADLDRLMGELAEAQGEAPMVVPSVDHHAVADVVEDWTGIPVGRMMGDEIASVLTLADQMAERVIGQDHAMAMIAKRLETSRAGLTAPEKPVGVFLLAGPSGVGKTETALSLAEVFYGGEQAMVTINMSEFQEAHTVSTLKGAPPGYVGYGEGGVLTEAVRRRPYSVVLLDEVEKAHSDVHEIFFQVFDKGAMEDGEGRHIDFRHSLIILTSNVGTDVIMDLCKDPELAPEPDKLAEALRPSLLKVFPPALLGRVTVIPYFPLADQVLDKIIGLKLRSITKRLMANHGIEFAYSDAVLAAIRERCTEIESGGRMIDAILTNSLLPAVSREVLGALAEGRKLTRVSVDVTDGAFSYNAA